ncbi:ParA family protein, partial [Treponema pallidum]
PISSYDAQCAGARSYEKLAREIVARDGQR